MRVSSYQTSGPEHEPITLLQAKAQCGVDESFTDDDELLTGLVSAAREYCEQIMHRAIFNQSWRLVLDDFPYTIRSDQAYMPVTSWVGDWYRETAIRLPMAHVVNVASVTYTNDLQATTVLPSSAYHVDTSSEMGSIIPLAGAYWPMLSGMYPGAVVVDYVAGSWGDGTDLAKVPPSIKNAILLLVAHWYAHREATDPQTNKSAEFSVNALLRPYVVRS